MQRSRVEWKPNSEGWFCDATLQRKTALHLTYLLFAQFPLCTTVHLGSGCSLPKLLSGSPRKIIANPAFPTPKSDRAKRPCALFKISIEQTHVPVAASHYRTRQTYIRLLFAHLIAQKRKEISSVLDRGRVNQTRLFSYCLLHDDYSIDDKKYRTMITLKSLEIRALLTVWLALKAVDGVRDTTQSQQR